MTLLEAITHQTLASFMYSRHLRAVLAESKTVTVEPLLISNVTGSFGCAGAATGLPLT